MVSELSPVWGHLPQLGGRDDAGRAALRTLKCCPVPRATGSGFQRAEVGATGMGWGPVLVWWGSAPGPHHHLIPSGGRAKADLPLRPGEHRTARTLPEHETIGALTWPSAHRPDCKVGDAKAPGGGGECEWPPMGQRGGASWGAAPSGCRPVHRQKEDPATWVTNMYLPRTSSDELKLLCGECWKIEIFPTSLSS